MREGKGAPMELAFALMKRRTHEATPFEEGEGAAEESSEEEALVPPGRVWRKRREPSIFITVASKTRRQSWEEAVKLD